AHTVLTELDPPGTVLAEHTTPQRAVEVDDEHLARLALIRVEDPVDVSCAFLEPEGGVGNPARVPEGRRGQTLATVSADDELHVEGRDVGALLGELSQPRVELARVHRRPVT